MTEPSANKLHAFRSLVGIAVGSQAESRSPLLEIPARRQAGWLADMTVRPGPAAHLVPTSYPWPMFEWPTGLLVVVAASALVAAFRHRRYRSRFPDRQYHMYVWTDAFWKAFGLGVLVFWLAFWRGSSPPPDPWSDFRGCTYYWGESGHCDHLIPDPGPFSDG